MSAAELLLRDAESRRRALEPASFIVEAPAGAGKTELLTQRFLMLLARVEAPEEIVAITFTRKAAAEMRSRILDALVVAGGGQPPAAEHKRVTFALAREVLAVSAARGWGLAEQPARLRVTTIDALCASLARQMPLLSRFGGEPRVVDDARRHYAEAARRTLALLSDEGEAGDAVAAALLHLDNDGERLAELLEDMLARRDQWLGLAVRHPPYESAREALETLVTRELAGVADVMAKRLSAEFMAVARFAAGNLGSDSPIAGLVDWQGELRGGAEDLPRWRGVSALALTQKGTVRSRLTKDEGLPAGRPGEAPKAILKAWLEALPEAAVAALVRVRRLPDPTLDETEWQTVAALARVLTLAAAHLWQVFREVGETDFVEVAQRSLAALGDGDDPTDLALRLDYRIRHLLVDEFQDTSPAQVELLSRLTAGWTPGDGRTLFLVGDPMQSIYRFRKAEVSLFLQALGEGVGGLPLERLVLARNNRSAPAVVDWVNGAFGQVLPEADAVEEGAIAYRAFAAGRPPADGAGVAVHGLLAPKEAAGLIEARCVIRIIDDTWAEDPDRSIAVLVKAKKHLAPLVAQIRRLRPDLRYQAVEIDSLAERQPVQDLLALTRALHHRADRVHWLALLRCPWCGLTLSDMHIIAGGDREATIWSRLGDGACLARLSPDGRERAGHLRAALAEAFAQRGRLRLRRWVEGTWLALGGPACLADAAEAADAQAFLDLLDRLDGAGRFFLDSLDDEVARLFAAADGQADGRLQFMSIHKSKGLEFDTVIVPGLHHKPPQPTQPLVRWESVPPRGDTESEPALLAAPLRPGGRPGATAYGLLALLEKARSRHEAERLLYVAATRAQRFLHWVGVLAPGAEGEAKPAAGSLLELLWPVVAAAFAGEPAPAAPIADAADLPPPLRRLRRPAPMPWVAGPAHPAGAGGPAIHDPAQEEGRGDRLDADVGTLVHAYLEMIAREGLAAWPHARLSALEPAMGLWFAQRGHPAPEAERGAARACAALNTTLESDGGRWVLGAHQDAAAELALAGGDANGIALHIVDRCFIADGVRWIVDYKTGPAAGDEETLRALAERHRPQLERYAGLFAAEGSPRQLAVFFTSVGRLVPLCAAP